MRRALPLLVLLLVFAGGLPAAAEDWNDAKSAFKKALRSEDWKTRATAFGELAYYDGTKAVQEILKVLAKEKNEAVALAAVKALAAFVTDEAKAELEKQLKTSKGQKRLYIMLVLEQQPGNHGSSIMMEFLAGEKDLALKCQAALVLANRQVKAALPYFYNMCFHKDWHVRSAGARALEIMAGKKPEKPTDPKEKPKPWVPEWYPKDKVVGVLIDAFEQADGAERRAMLSALERVTKQQFGWDVPAWRALQKGTPVEKIKRKPKHPPYFFGVPVWGKRVAIVTTINHRISEPHNYTDKKRLQELCEVPGARSVAWPKIKTNRHFMMKHMIRTVLDMESGTKFNVYLAGQKVESLFPKLVSANRSTKNTVSEELEEVKSDAGNDAYTSLMEALDLGGSKDSAAWSKGPDEILYVSCAIPWLAEVTDQQVIGASVGLKARRRMVPIVAVGVGEHPYELMELMAELTGGLYRSLER
ncbi:MAG: HEAT repeat domain-containing protein [Planctomycetota bacterium]|nr:HEAT repeat domain-containing protein [Planctomycetota bacterium]